MMPSCTVDSRLQAQWKLEAIGRAAGASAGCSSTCRNRPLCTARTVDRREAHACKQFTFLGYTFRPRGAKDRYGKLFESFLPAVSLEATKKMLRTIKSWKLSRQTPASIGELAARYNPILRGWLNYYGHFYKSALLKVFDSLRSGSGAVGSS